MSQNFSAPHAVEIAVEKILGKAVGASTPDVYVRRLRAVAYALRDEAAAIAKLARETEANNAKRSAGGEIT